jgi:hypothetical protein
MGGKLTHPLRGTKFPNHHNFILVTFLVVAITILPPPLHSNRPNQSLFPLFSFFFEPLVLVSQPSIVLTNLSHKSKFTNNNPYLFISLFYINCDYQSSSSSSLESSSPIYPSMAVRKSAYGFDGLTLSLSSEPLPASFFLSILVFFMVRPICKYVKLHYCRSFLLLTLLFFLLLLKLLAVRGPSQLES